jgi:hypothetical protein
MKSRILPFCILLIGVYWVYKGWFDYKFWENNGPAGGFLVVIVGLLCCLMSLIEIVKGAKIHSLALNFKNFIPILACIVLIGVSKLLGMVLSLGLLMFIWLVFLEKYPIRKATVIGVCTVGFIYVVFTVLFNVPFPVGYLGI